MKRRGFLSALAASLFASLRNRACGDQRIAVTHRGNLSMMGASSSGRSAIAHDAAMVRYQSDRKYARSLGVVDLFRDPDPRATIRALHVGRTFVIVSMGNASAAKSEAGLSRLHAFAQMCAEEGVDLDIRVMARHPLDDRHRAAFQSILHEELAAALPALRSVSIENEINNDRYWEAPLESYAQHLAELRSVVAGVSSAVPVLGFGPASLGYIWAVSQDFLNHGRAAEALALYRAGTARRIEPRVNSAYELQTLLRQPRYRRAIDSIHMYLRPDFSGDTYQLHYYEPWHTLPTVVTWIRAQLGRPVRIDAWELGFAWLLESADLRLMERELIALVGSAIASGVDGMTYLPLVSQRATRGETERWLGLRNPDGSDRPAIATFAELAAALRQEHRRVIERGTVNAVRLQPTQGGSETVLAWPLSPDGKVTVAAGQGVEWDGTHWISMGRRSSEFARLLRGDGIRVE